VGQQPAELLIDLTLGREHGHWFRVKVNQWYMQVSGQQYQPISWRIRTTAVPPAPKMSILG
jgi:hypothetical protein